MESTACLPLLVFFFCDGRKKKNLEIKLFSCGFHRSPRSPLFLHPVSLGGCADCCSSNILIGQIKTSTSFWFRAFWQFRRKYVYVHRAQSVNQQVNELRLVLADREVILAAKTWQTYSLFRFMAIFITLMNNLAGLKALANIFLVCGGLPEPDMNHPPTCYSSNTSQQTTKLGIFLAHHCLCSLFSRSTRSTSQA